MICITEGSGVTTCHAGAAIYDLCCGYRCCVAEGALPFDQFVDLIFAKTIQCYTLCVPELLALAAVNHPGVIALIAGTLFKIEQGPTKRQW